MTLCDSSENEVRLFKYSPDGALLACLMGDHVLILSTEGSSSPNELTRLPGSFLDIEFSPKGHYFSTFGRYVKGTEEEPHENVTMWAVATGAKVFSYTQKTQTKNWAVQWTANEEFFGRMVSTEVQFFEVAQMGAGGRLLCSKMPTKFRVSHVLFQRSQIPSQVGGHALFFNLPWLQTHYCSVYS